MTKFLKLTLLLNLFITPVYATMADPDPCADIEGNWKGKWTMSDNACVWDATVKIAKDDSTVMLIVTVFNLNNPHPKTDKCLATQTWNMSGTCFHGKLFLHEPGVNGYEGVKVGNSMFLSRSSSFGRESGTLIKA